jgi:hypothetical protein
VWAARSFYEHRHEQLQQLGSSFHLAQLEPFLNLFNQGRPWVRSSIMGLIRSSSVLSQHIGFDPSITGSSPTLWVFPSILGLDPSILGSIPASWGSIPASWVRSHFPLTQWNMRGGRLNSVEYLKNIKKIPFYLFEGEALGPEHDGFVWDVCRPILELGPETVIPSLYWRAIESLARTTKVRGREA